MAFGVWSGPRPAGGVPVGVCFVAAVFSLSLYVDPGTINALRKLDVFLDFVIAGNNTRFAVILSVRKYL